MPRRFAIASQVRIAGVTHRFGNTEALRAIDLTISAGSFVALVGPSGCGKSTLLRLISGLEQPSIGKLSIEYARPATPGSGARLAFVFQDAHLLPWRSVLDNVLLPLEFASISRAEARARALAALADVELSDVTARFPDQLSGGMRMRVSIARALVSEPELLLMDEPFAALDELSRQRLDERLRALWLRRGISVLFVTHSLAEAAFLAERVVVFSRRPGRVVLDHTLNLPRERSGALRSELTFVRETAVLYRALEAHESLDDTGS